MILLVDLPQVLPVDVRVDLRRRNVGVAEHFLHRAEVGAALEQVRRERVPQRVRRHVLLDLRAARRTSPRIFHAPMRVSGAPRALRNSTPFPPPFSSRGRSSRMYVATAPIAERPIGTSRSLLPLPKTRTSLSSSMTSRTPSVIHSDTRSPAPYASSSIARSRKTSGSSSVGAASSRETSSTVSTSGSVRQRFGVSSRSLGSRATTPSASRNRK